MTSPDAAAPPHRGCLYRLLRAVAVVVGLVALAVVSGYIAMHRVMDADRVEVPRAVGIDSVAAEALIKEAGLTPRVVAEEFSATIPKGSVASQRPARGTRVALGTEVRLILSRGSAQLAAPDLAGLTLTQAKRVIAETGLTLGPVISIHSDAHARESIVAQDPPAGAPLIRGATVSLLQSVGPLEDVIVLPDLRGREMLVALNLLKELQLEARLSFYVAVAKEGRVIAQDPPPGSQIKVGGQVQLTIGE